MAEQAIFRIDVNAYLGHNYNLFRDKLFSLAIGSPSQYFSLREEVVKKVKEQAVKNLYETIFDIMVHGEVDGAAIEVAGVDFEFVPNVPPQKVNEMSLSAAKTLDKILDDILEIICPLDYKSIASKRLSMHGEATTIK